MEILTPRLKLVLSSHEETVAMIESMTPEEKAQFSAAWLAQIDASSVASPWTHGFSMVLRGEANVVGQCAFKAPPDANGAVEIAYGVSPEQEGNGYATEAAEALTEYAFGGEEVRIVRAHTLPEQNASTRILTKLGFQKVGEFNDPEDGLVWRWERTR